MKSNTGMETLDMTTSKKHSISRDRRRLTKEDLGRSEVKVTKTVTKVDTTPNSKDTRLIHTVSVRNVKQEVRIKKSSTKVILFPFMVEIRT